MKISTTTQANVTKLLATKDKINELGKTSKSLRQLFVENAIADIREYKAQNPNVTNKDIAIEYNLQLDAIIPENRLVAEREIIDYIALNSNISNTIEYTVAVKLKALNATNSRLKKCANNDDYKALIQIMDRARRLAFLEGEEEQTNKPVFKMDLNGNLERINK